METIYLDYNATTPLAQEVKDAMYPYFNEQFGNPSSGNAYGIKAKEAIRTAREQVAELLDCHPSEIIFTSGGTESNNHAIKGVAAALKDKGRHIITSSIEHPAVIEVCKYLEKNDYEVTYLPVDHTGWVNPEDVTKVIRPDTILISIMHANNEVGTLQPLSAISAIARENGILFHTDASQSIGKVSANVNELGVDLLTIAGHKLYAPKGIGALYIKTGTPIENLIHGAGQESGVRPGTENVMHIVGLGQACELARLNLGKASDHLYSLRNILIDELKQQVNVGITIHTPLEESLPNTLSIAFDGISAHALAAAIQPEVMIATGSACHSGTTQISSVLQAMGINVETGQNTVRISVGKYSAVQEMKQAANYIAQHIQKLSAHSGQE